MNYTLTVNTDNPQELADLLFSLAGGSKSVKTAALKNESASNSSKEETPAETTEAAKVTKEMVRELTSEKVQNGKSAKVKELLKKYNAKNAATVPEESFADFYNDLKAA